MSDQILETYIGDSIDFTIPMTWGGAAFDPGLEWGAIWTCKRLATDDDAQSLIQKRSGTGIVFSGTSAIVTLIQEDTEDLTPSNIRPVWDVQLQNISNRKVRTVASGVLTLIRDVTRKTEPSIGIKIIEPESPWPPVAGVVNATVLNYDVCKYTSAMFVVDNSTLRILTAADHGRTIYFTNAAAISVILNNGLPGCFYCTIIQIGTGVPTVGGSATQQRVAGYTAKTSGQFAQMSIANYGLPDIYLIGGQLGT